MRKLQAIVTKPLHFPSAWVQSVGTGISPGGTFAKQTRGRKNKGKERCSPRFAAFHAACDPPSARPGKPPSFHHSQRLSRAKFRPTAFAKIRRSARPCFSVPEKEPQDDCASLRCSSFLPSNDARRCRWPSGRRLRERSSANQKARR